MTLQTQIKSLTESFITGIVDVIEQDRSTRLRAALDTLPKNVGTTAAPRKEYVRNVTPTLARARKLQGHYLGSLRRLKGKERAKAKAIAKADGVAAAIKFIGGLG